ncbi:MAG: transposase, partial [Planctomycetaceae bacterium]
LRTERAYLLKEDFQWFWEYRSPTVAMRFLDEWCGKVVSGHLKTGHSGAPQNQPADWYEKGWVWTG